MIDALISGKLTKGTELRIGPSGKPFCNFMLSVPIGEPQPMLVTGIAFGDAAERLAKLGKGDAVSVAGGLKPTEWQDKATGETKRGFNITVNNALSLYDIKKRKIDDSKGLNNE